MCGDNLFSHLVSGFPADTLKVFLEHDRGVTTFDDTLRESARIASLLKRSGVQKGDRVVVQVEKSPECVLLYLACLRVAAVFVPLNTAYTATEVDYFLGDAAPRLFVCDPERENELRRVDSARSIECLLTLDGEGCGSLIDSLDAVEPDDQLVSCAPDDLAAILYTSGTTGRSKGAMITHSNLSSNASALHKYWAFEQGDVLLHALPIFHLHGLFVALHCALLNGSRVLFHTRFKAADIIRDLPQTTVMMGVPTFYVRLLDQTEFSRELVKDVRVFISGSAPLLNETFIEFEQRTGHRILERYGMTETGIIASNPYSGDREAGTVGFALPAITVRVVNGSGYEVPRGDVGVLEVSGPNVFAGYWQMPEKTTEEFRNDGYFITGDMATMDEYGRVAIVGRAKDLVISGGFNVYPKEVETEIDGLPGVKESAVIGVPHPDFGEAVTAVVVPDRAIELDIDSVLADLGERLARFKVPKKLFVVDALPRNAMGKVQKNQLREAYRDAYSG